MSQHEHIIPDCFNTADSAVPVSLVIDRAHTGVPEHHGLFSGWQWDSLRSKLLRAGLNPTEVQIVSLEEIASLKPTRVIVGFGESVLRALTDKRGIDKWQLSPLVSHSGIPFIPTFDMGRTQKQYELNLYQEMALRRAFDACSASAPDKPISAERFLLNPGLEETLAVLESIKDGRDLAVDVETGYGQINTVGFAWSESDAIAINVLPDRFADNSYFRLWRGIQDVLGSPGRKIFQNFIYDCSYFSAYGVRVNGEIFDTMWAMKVLWPELKSNLGNVGRVYTRRPYWKDDGKVTDEEGKKKDWGNVRDWHRHYVYNARDTTGTFEASRSQINDLKARSLFNFFNLSVSGLTATIREMCANGMPLDLSVREQLKAETEARVADLTKAFHAKVGSELNPRSSRQVLKYLKDVGVKLPKKFDKEKGVYRESADSSSIKKIRLKKDLPGLAELQEIKTLEKALSSYINFDVRPDGRLSYSLNGCGTETLRFSGGKDPWDRGFNIQTIPREGGSVSIKQMFVAPEGWTFIEPDLKAAETWYVAYASLSKKLMEMLHDGADVHKHVAHAILKALQRPSEEYSKLWRNLGKKTGHGANYLMKEATFVENVFKDMDMVLSKAEGKLMLESYFQEFPEIRRWHGEVKRELYLKRKLSAPSGWERYFYGRPGDDMLREAVPWAPQHMVPWIVNHMMFYLMEERRRGSLKFRLICQVHDAIYLLVPDAEVERVARACLDVRAWHPRVELPGGELIIPVEVETAKCLAHKEVFHG